MGGGAGAIASPPDETGGGNKVASPNKEGESEYQKFVVSLGFWGMKPESIHLPDSFRLKISYESFDFVSLHNEIPIVQFPFQNVICWGSSVQNFQFKLFNFDDANTRANSILISLVTTQGRKIENITMSAVQSLMKVMESRAMSKQEFQNLLDTIFESKDELKEGWLTTVDQFTSTGRLFLAKQGMDLLLRVGTLAPFEKFDLAVLLYSRIINKESFQLLVNTFESVQEKDNLIHRLQLSNQAKRETRKQPIEVSNLSTNTMMLPEKQRNPGELSPSKNSSDEIC